MAKRPPQLWRYTSQLASASQHVDRFVAPSRFCADMHKERGFSRDVGVLPYFTDRCDQDWQASSPRPQARPYFLFVGRLEEIKGVQRLIATWPKVYNSDLLIVGTGTFEEELRTQAAETRGVKFLGARSQDELGHLYHHAEACLVPSLTYETFGIILIEAFARKTPVIAHDLGALTEVVEQSRGGLLYRTDAELLTTIRTLQESPRLRNELAENGYRAFLDHWTREAHLQKYSELLETTAFDKFGYVPWRSTPAVGKPICQLSSHA